MANETATPKKSARTSAKTAKKTSETVTYTVKDDFFDKEDRDHRYKKGDTYPRDGYTPSEERIKSLSTKDNSAGRPFIE